MTNFEVTAFDLLFQTKNDNLIEFICIKCNYALWVPRFIVEELEQDSIFDGFDASQPPQPDCQVCDGTMTPKSYTGIRGVTYNFK